MRKVFLNCVLLLCALIAGSSSVWADDPESGNASITFSEQSLSDATSVNATSFNVGDYFTVTCTKNGAGTEPTYYTTGTAVRCYVTKATNNGNIITIARTSEGVSVNAYITSVTYSGTHSKKGTTYFTYSGSPSSTTETSASYAAASEVTTASATVGESGGSQNGQFYLTGVTVNYVYTPSSDTRELVNITGFSAVSSELLIGSTTTTTVTNNQGGWTPSYTYASNNTSVATVNSSGEITAVAAGTARITVSLNIPLDDPNYREGATISKYVDITVIDARYVGFNMTKATYSTASASSVTWSSDVVSVVNSRNGSGNTAANNYLGGSYSYTKFYTNHLTTITPGSGITISSIVCTANSTTSASNLDGSKWTNASHSVSGSTVTITPTTGTNPITINISGQVGLTEIKVYYTASAYLRSGLTDGKWGTICLPFAVAADEYTGATIYNISGKRLDGSSNPTSIVLEEETGNLVAGRPYIFQANDDEILAYFTGYAALAGSNNGLVGTYVATEAAEGKYVISSNQVKKCGTGCIIDANRAYIDMSNVPNFVGSSAPSIREIPLAPENATNIEVIDVERKAAKFFENGQLLINRDGIVYDALGRVVK